MARFPIRVALLAIMVGFGQASVAFAQSAPTPGTPSASDPAAVPDRNGNIWGGFAHEPNPSAVLRKEQDEGIAPSHHQTESIDRQLEEEEQQLIRKAQQPATLPPA
ncbi:MAG TPA: hypothetical protein VGH36_14000 [Acetobacteraceae bacterium]|jgi:hypothetical protein